MSSIQKLTVEASAAWDKLCDAQKVVRELRHEWCVLKDKLDLEAKKIAEGEKTSSLIEAASLALYMLRESIADMEEGPSKDSLRDGAEEVESAIRLARGED